MEVRLSFVKGLAYNWVAFGKACNVATFVTSVPLRKMANGHFCDIAGQNVSNQFSFYGKRRVMNREEYTLGEREPKSCAKMLNST